MWLFPSLSTSLIHPLSLSHSSASSSPGLSLPRFKDACGSLALCVPGGNRGRLAGSWWLSQGQARGLHLEEVFFLYSPGLVTLGLFSTEKGLSFSGLDPCFVFFDTKGSPMQGCVYLEVGALVLSCILLLTTATRCTLCP